MNRVLLLRIAWIASASAAALAQTAPRVTHDISHAEPRNERQLLDVYSPPSGFQFPVVVWIHGGGWMYGSKNGVEHRPAAFVEKGYVFVPVNYRFIPR